MNNKFEDFQLEEYKNISNAHFETNKQIGIFFRYFLLIVSAPSFIIIWLGKDNPDFINNLLNGNRESLNTNLFIGCFLILISIIGAFSAAYLVGIKLDNVLYARTINGMRKYFYEKAKIKNEETFRYLSKQTNVPKYRDFHTFGVLYYAIALIDSIYFSLGTSIIAGVGNYFFSFFIIKNYNNYWSVGVFTLVFICHIIYYLIVSKFRRISYLRSRIIGVDIDGVLNKHRETFCKVHKDNLNKIYRDNIPENKLINPDDINRIPVHLIGNKDIDRNDEFDVFNNPTYWFGQELCDERIPSIIKEIRNSFGYRIVIHSFRPWPQFEYGNILKENEINKLWKIKTVKCIKEKKIKFGESIKTIKKPKKINIWQGIRLRKITKQWLKISGIKYDKLYIEKNSLDSSRRSFTILGLFFNISVNSFKNRFYYTSKKPYRYFVEDDIDNAVKLAINCEFVFLINQPYNQTDDNKLPKNILRVDNWSEIKNKIKILG